MLQRAEASTVESVTLSCTAFPTNSPLCHSARYSPRQLGLLFDKNLFTLLLIVDFNFPIRSRLATTPILMMPARPGKERMREQRMMTTTPLT